MKTKTLKITYSAIFLCLALVLPFFTGQIKIFGKMLNLMHVAVFLCGMTCGCIWGGIIGFIAPLLRSVVFGMPTLYPNAVAMAFELAVYGFVSGFIFLIFYNKKLSTFIALIVAMIIGRLVWGIASLLLFSFVGKAFTFALFIKGAFVDGVVGIVLHLIIVPIIINVLKRANLLLINK